MFISEFDNFEKSIGGGYVNLENSDLIKLNLFGVLSRALSAMKLPFGSTLLDLLIFYLVFRFFGGWAGKYAELLATAVARLCSSFANFNANNTVVFANKGSYKRAMLRYYCLCIPQMLISAGLVTLINHLFSNTVPIIATIIKFVVDTCLFFISYNIQREWVFSQKEK